MAFFAHEIDLLKKSFPNQTADLESDFDSDELDAIENVGVLRGNAHYYLGNFSEFIFTIFYHFFKILNSGFWNKLINQLKLSSLQFTAENMSSQKL